MKTTRRTIAVSLLAVLLTAVAVTGASAQPATTVTGPPDCGEYEGVVCTGWFTDAAGVVDDEARIEEAVGRLVARYGTQIAVVTVTDSRGRDPLTFAQEIGNAWGVGDAERRDGIVVLVDIDARETAVTTGPGISLPESEIAAAGDSFFGAGDFEAGLLAIIGALERELEAATETGDGGDGDAEEPVESEDDGAGAGLVVLGVIGLVGAVGIGAGVATRRRERHDKVAAERRSLVDDDLHRLEPAGHEVPRAEEYAAPAPAPPDVATHRVLSTLGAVDRGEPVEDGDAAAAAWGHGLVAMIDRDRLIADSAVPLELRAADERQILEGAVQQGAKDALAVRTGDETEFEVRRQELQRLVASLRPHRVAAARERAATAIANSLATTPWGEALMTDPGARFLRSASALEAAAPVADSVTEIEALYSAAQAKTDRLTALYERLPASTTRPAVAAALADLTDDPDDAVARYEKARAALDEMGTSLTADGLAIPALAALLLMNNDDEDVAEFVEAYNEHRARGHDPDEAVEYALAGLRTPKEIEHVRAQSKRLGLPVAITAALLRRRDDGPEIFEELLEELARQDVDDGTRQTIAGILAVSMEPAQAIRRWLEARDALRALGLEGAYADVAAAFGASDPRGPRVFALAYAAQRQALARSDIDDADRFAPELAHEGTANQTDSWTGEPIPRGLTYFDPFTLLFYHWIITRGHHGSYGWEPIYRDNSWSGDRSSWMGGGFGGWGGGGGFSGGGGSSWGGGSWGGGSFGGFGGGGGFSGGGGSGW